MTQQSEQVYRYEAFISYRHTEPDMAVAMALHQALEQFSVPPTIKKALGIKKMGKVFRDQEELPTSSDLGKNIENALSESKWLIVIASRRLLESRWCMREVDYFIELGRRDRILLVLIEGEPNDSFPPQLRFADVDGTTVEVEPLAADLRAADVNAMKKKLKREKLRLLAPMLNLGFDDLYRRAHKHFVRKAIAVSVAAAVFLSAAGGGVAYQVQKTEEAKKLAASENIERLISSAERYQSQEQQAEAVRASREALTLARKYGLDETGAATALYNAFVLYPYQNAYAKLTHTNEVNAITFSPDGTLLAALSGGTTVTVWDTRYASKLYEISFLQNFDPGRMTFPNINGTIYELAEWGFRLVFTEKNELIVYRELDYGSSAVSKYDAEGNAVFTTEIDMAAYYPPCLYSLDSADAIFLADDEHTWIFDIDTGEILSDYESQTIFYSALSSDQKSLAILSGDGSDSWSIFDLGRFGGKADFADAKTDGTLPEEVVNALTAWNGTYGIKYLYDSFFVVADNQDGFFVWDAQSDGLYAVPDIVGSKSDKTSVPIILPAAENGSFWAGYNDTFTDLYTFDGGEVTKIGNYIDVESDGTAVHYGYGEKDADILVSDVDDDGTAYRVVADSNHEYQYTRIETAPLHRFWNSDLGFLFYSQDEDEKLLVSVPEAYYCSGTGLVAEVFEASKNVVTLLNVKTSPNAFALTAPTNPIISNINPYFDIDRGLSVYADYDSGGIYFGISRINDGNFAEPEKVYLPDTKGHSGIEDSNVIRKCVYGPDYAVVVREYGDYDAETGIETLSAYVLNYETAELKTLIEKTQEPISVSSVNEKGIIMRTGDYDTALYDPDTGKVIVPEIEIDWETKKNEENILPHTVQNGPLQKNIALLVYMNLDDEFAEIALLDFDKEECIFTNQPTEGMDGFIWAQDGSRLFSLAGQTAITAFEITDGAVKKLGSLEIDGAPIDMNAHAGDVLSVVTDKNSVEFYDMHSLEKLCSVSGITDAVCGVTYNDSNGIAAVSTNSAFWIYDLKNDRKITEELNFPLRDRSIITAKAFVSNSGKEIIFSLIDFQTDKANNGGSTYNHAFDSFQLLSGDALMEATEAYEIPKN
ncbi:MAG: TIR domain-containing protein [Clostridiales Family XIII bacterium]|jgi:WD40 repeat protein|nr:TIR domain-containing protein [Clostridiales Family XIII bacterium]